MIQIDNMKIQLLGDPHLGRPFIHGTPLHRQGERELSVWGQFERELQVETGTTHHINMGDLFDRSIVPYRTIMRAAEIYRRAAERNPNCQFIVLKGNHDWQRDLEHPSAFDIFAKLTSDCVTSVSSPLLTNTGLALFGYHPVDTAADLAKQLDLSKAKAAFGHWDVDGYGNEHNVVPTKVFSAAGLARVFTGHIHKPDAFERDGVAVTVVGSMQPYAHGEEINDEIYITLSLKDVAAAGDLRDKCVRILLGPGEMLEDEIDCLQLVTKRLTGANDNEAPSVSLGEFDMEALFQRAFAETGVPPAITIQLKERYDELRIQPVE